MHSLKIFLSDPIFMRFLRRWVGLALCIHLLTCFFSIGYHHHDEHFQIVEFINLKLGGTLPADLPWEFQDKMRPWLQPFLLYLIAWPLKQLGMENTYVLTTLFRLISAVLGWVSLLATIFMGLGFLRANKVAAQWLVRFLCLWWFFPYLHARASSDNWGAAFLILGLAGLNLYGPLVKGKIGLIIGLFLGFAIEFRFQAIAAVGPVLLWMVYTLLQEKKPIVLIVKSVSLVLIGLCLAKGIGIAIDTWGYETFTISQWNYLVEDYKAHIQSTIMPSPWWDYFRLSFMRGIPPLSILCMVGVVYFWWKNPKNIMTWATFPFVIAHTAIAHKELRYLYPVICLAPLMTYIVFSEFLYARDWLKKPWWRPVSRGLLGLNLVLLVISSLRPANGAVSFYHYMENLMDAPNPPKILYHVRENPYVMVGYPLRFFWPKELETKELAEPQEIDLISTSEPIYLFTRTGKDFWSVKNYQGPWKCESQFLSYPQFFLRFNFGGWLERSRIWSLFYCVSKK
ncbi:MAG: hypothetical protein HYV97_03050 [Bdellovibrio sp.]|nr:hypothetical protein [Bdellovibrio sp.]